MQTGVHRRRSSAGFQHGSKAGRQRGRVRGRGLLSSSQAKYGGQLGADGSGTYVRRKAQVLKILESREPADSSMTFIRSRRRLQAARRARDIELEIY